MTDNVPKRNLRLTERDQRTGNKLGALNEKHVVAKAQTLRQQQQSDNLSCGSRLSSDFQSIVYVCQQDIGLRPEDYRSINPLLATGMHTLKLQGAGTPQAVKDLVQDTVVTAFAAEAEVREAVVSRLVDSRGLENYELGEGRVIDGSIFRLLQEMTNPRKS